MDLVLYAAITVVVLWLMAVAIISQRPQAHLARAVLASGGVIAGAWASSASAGMSQAGDVPLVLALLRTLS
jgi:hypothetical protein